jgi:hypothetical protein
MLFLNYLPRQGGPKQESKIVVTCNFGYTVAVSVDLLIFPSSRNIALELTQPLTEMRTRNLPLVKARPAPKASSRCTLPIMEVETKKKQTPWSESASEIYRPSDRRFSAKWLPTFADKGCHVVSVTDPYVRILGFLDRSRNFSIK